MKPETSIIIPTYNRAEYISSAISSVLAQSYADWELIVIDDGSTDTTAEVVGKIIAENKSAGKPAQKNIQYVRLEKNGGISAARNAGLSQAVGTYIAMLDSDDMWTDREKLAKQVAFLKENPGYGLVGTRIRTINSAGDAIGAMDFLTDDTAIRRQILRRNQFAQSSVLFLKKAAIEAGSYDQTLVVNEDYDLWLRLGVQYKFANLADTATDYRVHGGSIIRSKRLVAARIHLDIIKKHRKEYPLFGIAAVKSYLRILRAYF